MKLATMIADGLYELAEEAFKAGRRRGRETTLIFYGYQDDKPTTPSFKEWWKTIVEEEID